MAALGKPQKGKRKLEEVDLEEDVASDVVRSEVGGDGDEDVDAMGVGNGWNGVGGQGSDDGEDAEEDWGGLADGENDDSDDDDAEGMDEGGEIQDDGTEDFDEGEGEGDEEDAPKQHKKVISLEDLSRFKKKADRTGIIYLSRIPPGMGPSKVKHLLSQYGDVGRIYLQRDEKEPANKRQKGKEKHHSHRFTEGWVELKDKKVARSVADLLNARPIGGKKGTRWRDDIWTMKYLPKFKWTMLSEQVAIEAATRSSQLRNEVSQSRRDQSSYLGQVEKARVLAKRADREKLRSEAKRGEGGENGDGPRGEQGSSQRA